MRRGQAIIETLFAILLILLVFFGGYKLSRKVAARTLLDHAAARAARARAVGFNGFMCEKSARVAMIPVAGRRVWPVELDFTEASRIPIYLSSEDSARASGVLEYEYWRSTDVDVDSGTGLTPLVESQVKMRTPEFEMTGSAAIESHFPLYMVNGGK